MTTITNNATDILNTAIELVKNDRVRLTHDVTLNSVNVSGRHYDQHDNFSHLVMEGLEDGNSLLNTMSVDIYGLLAVATVSTTGKNFNYTCKEVGFGNTAMEDILGDHFNMASVRFMDAAFFPWTTKDESGGCPETLAAMNYQRRLRQFNGKTLKTQAAYKRLTLHILRRAVSLLEEGETVFRASREDFRAVNV